MAEPPRGHAERVVVFDGTCGFCAGAVRFVAARDRTGQIRFAPAGSPPAQARLARHGLDRAAARSIVFVEGDRCSLRSDAVLRIAWRLAFPWWLLAGLLVIPRPIRDAAYRLVAAWRHRLAGPAAACETLPAEIRSRLL